MFCKSLIIKETNRKDIKIKINIFKFVFYQHLKS